MANSNLTQQDLEQISKVVNDAIDSKQAEFWVGAEQHYQDHQQLAECRSMKTEWLENHRFTSELREGTALVKKVTLRTAIVAIVTFAIGWIAWHLKN